MSSKQISMLRKGLRMAISILTLGVSMDAEAGLFGFGGTNWKEEVLLHDGSRLLVERKMERGGRHEIGQQPPIKEQSLTFTQPTTSERITWKSEYSADVGLADFMPLLIDTFGGTAYLASVPVGCLSYNKWGRPNPPYVIFKYDGKEWIRVPLQELPLEIKTPNLIFSSPDSRVGKMGKSPVSAEMIQQINSSLDQPEYKIILREPLAKKRINAMCEELILYKGFWIMPNDPVARAIVDRNAK
ncbi:MAG: hypothetical protein NTV11_15320 [Rhodocyclales bacterium]|nr:hypothetical protein [Rhodocyclales bacterium]